MPLSAGLEGLVYNPEQVPGGIDELTDLWDPQFAGRSTIQGSYALPAIAEAALAIGIKDPMNMDAEELERAKQYLIDHADQFRTLWGSDSDLVNLFKSGEVVVAAAGPQLAQRIIDADVPAKWAYAKDGTLSWVCGFAITSKAQNIPAAYALMNWQSSPEAQAIRAQDGYLVTNKKAIALAPPDYTSTSGRRVRRPGDPRDPSARLPGMGPGVPRLQVADDKPRREPVTATPFTRREALKSGMIGVASLTVAERLLAYGGANEALAALRPTLAKQGYGPPCSRRASRWRCRRAFKFVRFGRAGSMMSDGLPMPTCHDGTGYFRGRGDTVWIVRNQEGFQRGPRSGRVNAYDPIAQGGVTVSHFDRGRERSWATRSSSTGPTTTATAASTPWGTWLTGEENTVGKEQGYGAEHGYVFEVPSRRDATGRAGADQGDGTVRPRGLPGGPEDGDRLHDRGQRRPRRRLLSLPAPPQGQAPSRRQAADARHPRPAEVQHRHATRSDGKKLECRWVDIKDPDPNGADRFAQAVYMQGRHKGGAKFMGLEGGTFSKGSCYFTASDGGTSRPGPDLEVHARQQGLQARHPAARLRVAPHRVLERPGRDHGARAAGSSLCEDGASEDVKGQPSRFNASTPNGKLFNVRQGDRADAAARQHRGQTCCRLSTSAAGTTRRSRARASAHSETSGVGFSPDGKWMFLHIQYPGETFAITGPWDKGWF